VGGNGDGDGTTAMKDVCSMRAVPRCVVWYQDSSWNCGNDAADRRRGEMVIANRGAGLDSKTGELVNYCLFLL